MVVDRLLKSDSSGDEKMFYAKDRVRNRYKKRTGGGADTDIDELEGIRMGLGPTAQSARARPRPANVAPTPIVRTQSDTLFDSLSRDNYELRRQVLELEAQLRGVETLEEELAHEKQRRREYKQRWLELKESLDNVQDRSPRETNESAPSSTQLPGWTPAFFDAMSRWLERERIDYLHVASPEAVPPKQESGPEPTMKVVLGAIQELSAKFETKQRDTEREQQNRPSAPDQASPQQTDPQQDAVQLVLAAIKSLNLDTQRQGTQDQAHAPPLKPENDNKHLPVNIRHEETSADAAAAQPAVPAVSQAQFDKVVSLLDQVMDMLRVRSSQTPSQMTLKLDPELLQALKVARAGERASEGPEFHDMPGLSSSGSTIEHDQEQEYEDDQSGDSNEILNFLQRVEDQDPSQAKELKNYIYDNINGDSPGFKQFVASRTTRPKAH